MSKQKFITLPKENISATGPIQEKSVIQFDYSFNDGFLRNAPSYSKFCSRLVSYPWVAASINCNEKDSYNTIEYSFSGRTKEEISNLKHEIINNVNNQEKFRVLGNLEETKFESPNSVECNRCCDGIIIIFTYNSADVFQLYCEYFKHLLQMFLKYSICNCKVECTKTKQIFRFRLQMNRPNIRKWAEIYMEKKHDEIIEYLNQCGFKNVIKTQQ